MFLVNQYTTLSGRLLGWLFLIKSVLFLKTRLKNKEI